MRGACELAHQAEEHERDVARNYKFKPSLSEGSHKIATVKPEIGQQSFLDRQSRWVQECREAELARHQQREQQDADLFRPHLEAKATTRFVPPA